MQWVRFRHYIHKRPYAVDTGVMCMSVLLLVLVLVLMLHSERNYDVERGRGDTNNGMV